MQFGMAGLYIRRDLVLTDEPSAVLRGFGRGCRSSGLGRFHVDFQDDALGRVICKLAYFFLFQGPEGSALEFRAILKCQQSRPDLKGRAFKSKRLYAIHQILAGEVPQFLHPSYCKGHKSNRVV